MPTHTAFSVTLVAATLLLGTAVVVASARQHSFLASTPRPTMLWVQATAVGAINARPTVHTVDGKKFIFTQVGPNVLMFTSGEGYIVKVFNSTAPTDGLGLSSPVLANGMVYFGAENNEFFAYSVKTNTKVWGFPVGTKIQSSAVLSPDAKTIYFGDDNGSVYALNAITGVQIWKLAGSGTAGSGAPGAGGITNQHLVLANGTLYFGNGYDVVAVDAATGTQTWSFATSNSVVSTVSVADGNVYAASTDKNLYQIQASSGANLASFGSTTSPINSSPVLSQDGQHVFYATQWGTITKVNTSSMNFVWSMNTFVQINGALAIYEGLVIAPSVNGLIALYAETGDFAWTWTIPQSPLNGGIAVDGNVLYFGDTIGTMYALQMSS